MIPDVSHNTPIYINFDLETTGRHPDHSAILSIGACAVSSVKVLPSLREFSMNLTVPNNRFWDESTRAWWEQHPAAMASCTHDPKHPRIAIRSFVDWLWTLMSGVTPESSPIVFVASPAAFDFPLLRSYVDEYGESGWAAMCEASGNNDAVRCLDLPTLAMAALKTEYPLAGRKYWPAEWKEGFPHTHEALSDARLQANAFKEIMRLLGKEVF